MVFSNNLLLGAAGAGGAGYEIDQSIRFDSVRNSDLTRTLSGDGNLKTGTFSFWMKRSGLGSLQEIFTTYSIRSSFFFNSNDTLAMQIYNGSGYTSLTTTAVFRDPSAFAHYLFRWDTTQATDTDRLQFYYNGVLQTVTGTYPAQNSTTTFSDATYTHVISGDGSANTLYELDAYLAEIHYVDGTALAATDFGEYNDDGVWIPIEASPTYGTNGFYITGEDSTFLGQDVRTSGDQVTSFQAAQYTGATSDYTFSDGRVEADTSNRAIRTVDTFTGDFEFTWRYVNMANFVIGLYEIDEDATFSSTSSAGNMQNMTDSWYVQTSSVASNRDIKYGGTTVVDSTTIANGDVWEMTRESGTIKVYRNDSLVHTFTQTSTNEVRLVIAQGDSAADANQIAWVDNSTLGNNFFSSGLATTDQMLDTPTDNYSIFNPVASCNVSGQTLTISDGNLRTSAGGTSNAIEAITQIGPSSGKWYAEFTLNAAPQLSNQYPVIGVIAADLNITGGNNIGNSTFRGYLPNGNTQGTGSGAYGDTFTTNDIVGCAIDLDNQKIWWSKNGVFQNSGDPAAGTNAAFTNLTAGLFYRFCISHAGSTATDVTGNFGQTGGFTYTPPTGFNALSTANLATPSITDGSKYFQPTLYTGNGTAIGSGGLEVNQSGNSTFQPDFAWIKNRTTAGNEHDLYDAVRGATKVVFSSTNGAEATVTEGLTAFDADGFTVGNRGEVNTSGNSMVAWQWKANGAGSSNTDGSVTSTVSNNSTSNFSIVKYTGTGSGNSTVGHGLGVTPDVIIVKHLDRAQNWRVFHTAEGVGKTAFLNSTAAFAADPDRITAVSSTTFTAAANMNESADYIAYCFAEVDGYSSFGSYTGNGSTDGPFVYTGFKPAFVMFKVSSNAPTGWVMLDSQRDTYNAVNHVLQPNESSAESSGSDNWDFLSNGFKPRTTWAAVNGNGYTVTYMAFAEHPFGGDGVAPATAR